VFDSVEICGDNEPPVWSVISEQHIDEDSGENILSMEGLIEDGEQQLFEMTFTVEANSDTVHLGADFDGSSLILTSLVENYNSSELINLTLTAFDTDYTATTDIDVYIDPVNDAPVADSVSINPIYPTLFDDLVLDYAFVDVDGDDESGTIITWFKNDTLQAQFADSLTIPSSATACDEEWYVVVKPNDGIVFGDPVTSNIITICATNTPPEWSAIPDQSIDEDSEDNVVDISGYISDETPDHSLSFEVIDNSDSLHLGAEFDGSNLILTTLIELK
jgi:hypothetical protein